MNYSTRDGFCVACVLSLTLSLTHETCVLMTHPATINEILLIPVWLLSKNCKYVTYAFYGLGIRVYRLYPMVSRGQPAQKVNCV